MANSLDRLREHLKNGDKLVLKNNEGQSTDDITKATMVETAQTSVTVSFDSNSVKVAFLA